MSKTLKFGKCKRLYVEAIVQYTMEILVENVGS